MEGENYSTPADGTQAPSKPENGLAAESLKAAIVAETFRVTGLGRYPIIRTLARALLQPAVSRFADMVADFERTVAESGLRQACQNILPRFVSQVETHGVELLPPDGPLLLASNHPAAYDFFIIAAYLPRDDLKLISSTISIVDFAPASRERFISISSDAHVRMAAVRSSIRHLRDGGSLLVFPTGLVDPDPEVLSGAHEALDDWSSSLALFLRRVPQTLLVPVIVSGVLSPTWARSPVTWLRSDPHNRLKIAEICQVIQQIFFPTTLRMKPHVSFGRPASLAELSPDGESDPTAAIIDRSHSLLDTHMATTARVRP